MTEFTECPIDLRYVAENQPSLCIPRVFKNITSDFIVKTFDKLALGKIHHIDLIERRTERGEVYNRAFIHFDKWFWNPDAQNARKRLITGKDIKIVYDGPWFWKVSANKWTPRTTENRVNQMPFVGYPPVPTSQEIIGNIAPTLDVGIVPPPSQSHNERRKKRPEYRSKQQPRMHQQQRLSRETKLTPPTRKFTPATPPGPPPRRQRPASVLVQEPVLPEEEVTEHEIREEQETINPFNVTDVRNLKYGDVPYPPRRTNLNLPKPLKMDLGEENVN